MENISTEENFVSLFLGDQQYRKYNVSIAKKIGVEESIVLNDLIDTHKYIKSCGKTFSIPQKNGKWFFYSSTKCEDRTAIKPKALMRIVRNLVNLGFITYIVCGVPAKRHFQIHYPVIFDLLKNISNKDSTIPKREYWNSQTGILIYESNSEPKEEIMSETDESVLSPPPAGSGREELFMEKPEQQQQPAQKKYTARDMQIAQKILQHVKALDDKCKNPNLENWAYDINKIHRLDKRSYEEIESMFCFACEHDFWKNIILSPSKLRAQSTRIIAQMKTSPAQKKTFAEKKCDSIEKNEKITLDVCEQYNIPPSATKLYPDFVMIFSNDRQSARLSLKENGFNEQLISALRKMGRIQ